MSIKRLKKEPVEYHTRRDFEKAIEEFKSVQSKKKEVEKYKLKKKRVKKNEKCRKRYCIVASI